MKKTILLIFALFILMSIRLDAKPAPGISIGFFYSSLQPYGEWMELDNELIVWRPNRINRNWRPYSNGRWSWTSDGWHWDSFEPFGWATYHYGRWYLDDYYGWIWIPGYEWAPAWVEWRYDNNYIGWAPLPPYASFRINLGIYFSIGWHSNYRYWNFVNYGHFYDHRVYRYYLDEKRCAKIFSGTKYRTNYYSERDRIINGGIDRSFIERRGGYRINERDISRVDNLREYQRSRGNNGDRVYAYRPSDREVANGRTTDKFDLKRGENRSSLDREKIVISSDREDGRTVITDRATERNRDINVERDTRRDEGRIREESIRNQSSDQIKRDTERERTRIESENKRSERPEAEPAQRNREERVRRESAPERQPVYERPDRSERPSGPERKIEERRESNYERPTPRMERGNDNSSGRNQPKESGRSSERRR
ncbi:MAG: hypothetical protein CVV24_04755 [Ignavibacteriae bacterium HGW-Ignavibacteriae-3]|nr:MAG: hypothetical protein CVV24_04755 [Ignavibacteriae bacterium HGW-Ignavibacteriae-3]